MKAVTKVRIFISAPGSEDEEIGVGQLSMSTAPVPTYGFSLSGIFTAPELVRAQPTRWRT